MKKNKFIPIIFICIGICLFNACIDEVEQDVRIIPKKETIGEYLAANPDLYEQFYKILEKTDMLGLMNSYGEYTCFAPVNEAVDDFIKSSEYSSIEEYPVEELKKVVLYQLIEKDTIRTIDFNDSRLRSNNMLDDNLQVRQENGISIINGVATLQPPFDVSLKNGILHTTNAIIQPDKDNVVGKLENPEYGGRFGIFFQALQETEVYKLLEESEDPTEYSYYKEKEKTKVVIPRKIRFTVLAESNETFNNAGIADYTALKKKYDDGNGSITDPANGFYRFVAYHCLRSIYDVSNFAWYSEMDGYEIIEPLCDNTLLQFAKIPEGVVFNRFTDEAGTVINGGEGVMITSDSKLRDILCSNGMIHEITSVLEIPDPKTYFSKKMRFNVCSFLPELMNIDVRGKGTKIDVRKEFPDATPLEGGLKFFKNMSIVGNSGRVVALYDYTPTWIRHQWDEILIGVGNEPLEQCEDRESQAGNTRYDVTLTIPPIPPGTWEIRFGFSAAPGRGMAQLYFDDVPAGIPFRMDYDVNYGIDGMDEETARKVLYYNSFMPFPTNITNGDKSSSPYTRVDRMRKVLGIYSFNETKHHALRFRTVDPGQLSLNFIEVIPVDQVPNEGTN